MCNLAMKPESCIRERSKPKRANENTPGFLPSSLLKTIIAILLIFPILLSLVSCGAKEYVYCEIGIKIPSGYRVHDAKNDFDLAFEKQNRIIGIRRMSFDVVIEDGLLTTHSPYTLAEIYRERIAVSNASTVFTHGDIPYFVYSISDGQTTYAYMPTFYKTRYAYFIITFICKNTITEGGRVEFLDICDTVYILPEYA